MIFAIFSPSSQSLSAALLACSLAASCRGRKVAIRAEPSRAEPSRAELSRAERRRQKFEQNMMNSAADHRFASRLAVNLQFAVLSLQCSARSFHISAFSFHLAIARSLFAISHSPFAICNSNSNSKLQFQFRFPNSDLQFSNWPPPVPSQPHLNTLLLLFSLFVGRGGFSFSNVNSGAAGRLFI